MIHFFANRLTNYLFKQNIINDDLPIYQYGFELAISSAIGILLVLFASYLFLNIWNGVLFVCLFLFLRSFTGGLHFDTYLKCNTGMLAIFLICIFTIKISSYSVVAIGINILSLFSIFIFSKFAPYEHKNKPLEESEMKKFKITSLIISITYYFIASILYWLQSKYFAVVYYVIVITAILLVISIRKEKYYEKDCI